MSHIVKLQTKMTDPKAIAAACKRLGLDEPVQGTAKVYGTKVTGTVINLPGWNYPLVIEADGTVKYDNYRGSWGDEEKLNDFQQAYGLECARQMAQAKGWSYSEVAVEDGAIEAHLTQYS